jgi:ABC-type phosphate/phosphonate transport system substrate-binding protein
MIKQLLVFFLLIFFIPSISTAQTFRGTETMGYLVDGMNDIRFKDTQLAFSLWTKEIALNEDMNIIVKFFENDKDIIKSFINLDIRYIAMNPIFYLQNASTLDPLAKQYWISQKTDKMYTKMLVLTRKDSGIKNLSDLKDKKITTGKGNYLGELFLDKEILQELHISSSKHYKELVYTKRYSTAILKTFFGKSDACIVPEYTLQLVGEMNPAVASTLVPIAQSENIFISNIALFHSTTEDWMMETFNKNAADLSQSVRGQSILDLFKMKKIRMIKKKELEPLKKYYKEYLDLKKKHGVIDDSK